MRKHPGEVREVPQVALRADPSASHQIVWGVWSGCPRLSQSDEGRHNDQNIAEWGVADCAQMVNPQAWARKILCPKALRL